jgi:ribosomal protein S25
VQAGNKAKVKAKEKAKKQAQKKKQKDAKKALKEPLSKAKTLTKKKKALISKKKAVRFISVAFKEGVPFALAKRSSLGRTIKTPRIFENKI